MDDGHDVDLECPRDGSDIIARTGCILSFAGCRRDCLINYPVFLVNLIWCIFLSVRASGLQKLHCTCNMAAFILVSLFQICLCLVVGCAGISIIWCAMARWAWWENRIRLCPEPLRHASENSSHGSRMASAAATLWSEDASATRRPLEIRSFGRPKCLYLLWMG
jgi:hypothetical protein